MAKASDLIGRSGASGFGPRPAPHPVIVPQPAKGDAAAHSAAKQKPTKGPKQHKGAGGHNTGVGGAPTSVRPKV